MVDEADFTDLLVFVPVAGGLALGGKVAFKAGQKVTEGMLVKTYDKLGRKMVRKGYDPFKEEQNLEQLSSPFRYSFS